MSYFTPSERCEITRISHRGRCEITVISHRPTGAVGNVCYFTPPPWQISLKIYFAPFHETLGNFSFFKFHVPGHTPRTHSWNTSRNALLGDFQERTPGQAFGANHSTRLKCQVLRLWILYKSNIFSNFMWKQTLKKNQWGRCEMYVISHRPPSDKK